MTMLNQYLSPLPFIAIPRGIRPEESIPVAEILFELGFRIIEVPLNSPKPLDSIAAIAKRFVGESLIGAGTVLSVDDVTRVHNAGGQLIVMPHSDGAVIGAAKRLNMICTPGIATPTEGFAALAAGADGLKLFPAELLAPARGEGTARGILQRHDYDSSRRHRTRCAGWLLEGRCDGIRFGLGAVSLRHDTRRCA